MWTLAYDKKTTFWYSTTSKNIPRFITLSFPFKDKNSMFPTVFFFPTFPTFLFPTFPTFLFFPRFPHFYFSHVSHIFIFPTFPTFLFFPRFPHFYFSHVSHIFIFPTFPTFLIFPRFPHFYFSHVSHVFIFPTFPTFLFFPHFPIKIQTTFQCLPNFHFSHFPKQCTSIPFWILYTFFTYADSTINLTTRCRHIDQHYTAPAQ